MILTRLKIPELVVLESKAHVDERGYFVELFKSTSFKAQGLPDQFLQDNMSVSKKGVVRGLHLQKAPFAQGKLVFCLEGAIWDVAIDIRPGSKTYGQWDFAEISAENRKAIYVPQGFLHGFQALHENTRVIYKCTNVYSKESEIGVRFDDPDLKIPWPLKPTHISPKDLDLPFFKDLKS